MVYATEPKADTGGKSTEKEKGNENEENAELR